MPAELPQATALTACAPQPHLPAAGPRGELAAIGAEGKAAHAPVITTFAKHWARLQQACRQAAGGSSAHTPDAGCPIQRGAGQQGSAGAPAQAADPVAVPGKELQLAACGAAPQAHRGVGACSRHQLGGHRAQHQGLQRGMGRKQAVGCPWLAEETWPWWAPLMSGPSTLCALPQLQQPSYTCGWMTAS